MNIESITYFVSFYIIYRTFLFTLPKRFKRSLEIVLALLSPQNKDVDEDAHFLRGLYGLSHTTISMDHQSKQK